MRTPPRVMPALITPFDGDEELDVAAHRHNVRFLSERHVAGFLVAGSTGEGPYLEAGERHALLAAARDELGDEPFLLCGIAAETLRQAAAQLGEAAAGGADAALVITPTTLVRGRHQLVEDHFAAVAAESSLPVLLYTVPPVTGYELPVEAVVRLAGNERVVGIKDSGGNPERIAEWVPATGTGFFTYCGASRAVSASMTAGAYGAITASANYAADLVTRAVDGDEEAQDELRVRAGAVEAAGVPGTKAAAERFGLRAGACRRPLRSIP